MLEIGGPAHYHHDLLLTGKWYGGADPLHAEGSPRVAAKIFVFMFLQKFRKIFSFVFHEIFLQFRKIFAKYEIKICATFSRNSKEIS